LSRVFCLSFPNHQMQPSTFGCFEIFIDSMKNTKQPKVDGCI